MLDTTASPRVRPTRAAAYRVTATGLVLYCGIAAALLTVCIWSGGLLSMKLGVRSSLTVFDLALIRYATPGVIFLPFLYRARHQLRQVPTWTLLGLVLGAGVPFFFLSSAGMQYAPMSHAGLLIPGTFPLFVTGMAVLVFKESISRVRLVGLLAILIGVVALVIVSLLSASAEVWKGDMLYISASFFWAVYTISLRVAGLPPLAATSLLGVASTGILMLMLGIGSVSSGINLASEEQLMTQFLMQGVVVGLLSGFSYGYAINTLGAERTAAMGAFTPVLISLLAIPLLQEPLDIVTACGLFVVGTGVVLASGMVKMARHRV